LTGERPGAAGERRDSGEQDDHLRHQDADGEEDQAEQREGAGREAESVTCVDVLRC